jgi:uncharacterized protein YbaR (Trm112 family)
MGQFLVCTRCGHGFPVREKYVDLLAESAIPPNELKELMREE